MPSIKTSPSVLFLTISVKTGAGGIASVNRSVIAALSEDHEVTTLSLQGEFAGKRFAFFRAAMKVMARRPDLVLVDHLHLAPIAYLGRLCFRLRYVIFCHGTELDGPVGRLRRRAIRAATLRIANSVFTAQRLRARFPQFTVSVCPLGVEPTLEKVRPVPITGLHNGNGDVSPIGPRVTLIVGRILSTERYKGHEELIRAFPAVIARCPEAQLVIAGTGDDEERLKALVRELGIGKQVLFTGWVEPEKLAWLLQRCHLLAMPSRHEGFGLTYVEAMRYRKPVIASNKDAAREVVTDQVTGLLVSPEDIVALAEAIARLSVDSELAATMGEAGYRRYEELFTFEKFAGRLKKLLAPFLPSRSDRRAA